MKTVVIDTRGWEEEDDFYNSFFRAVGAPEWHGRNFDALRDSIAGGQINETEVPYTVVVKNASEVNSKTRRILYDFKSLVEELAAEGCEISIRFEG